MKVLSVILACFAVLGAIDFLFGNKLGLGKEFKNGVLIMGQTCITIVGIMTIAPALAVVLKPVLGALSSVIPFDPSSIVGLLLANDMGATPLALQLALSENAAYFNSLITGSMMGVTLVYSIPLAMTLVPERKLQSFFLGTACGIGTIPVGCAVGGIMAGLSWKELLVNLVPLLLFCGIVVVLLLKKPDFSIKLFRILGKILQKAAIIGFASGVFLYLTELSVSFLAPISDGFDVLIEATVFSVGAFPLVYTLSAVLKTPLKKLGKKCGLSPASTIGFISSLATNLTTFAVMEQMDDKGATLNAAFSVSASFVLASHLAYTYAVNPDYVFPMIVGKLISGVCAVVLAWAIYKGLENKRQKKA